MHNERHIVNLALIGFMGAGKTSVGRIVADQLRLDYVDTDELIQSRTGRTINDIFAKDGEPAFRALEQQVTEELTTRERTLIATGGGLPTRPWTIKVEGHVNDGILEVCVENGFDPDSPAPRRHGLGLRNVRSRLETRFGPEARLSAQAKNNQFRAQMILPCRRSG